MTHTKSHSAILRAQSAHKAGSVRFRAGKTKISIRLVDVQRQDEIMFEQTVEQEFTDIRQVANLTFNIGGIVFPHPGEYRFQIYGGTQFLGERRIICREIELSSGCKDEG